MHDHSLLKKLAQKGVWDVAEARADGDRRLLEYLVGKLGITCPSSALTVILHNHLITFW